MHDPTLEHDALVALLPDEVLLRVLGELPAADLVTGVPLVCRRWHRLARDPVLWSRLHRRRLGGYPSSVTPSNDLSFRRRADIVPWRTRDADDEEDDETGDDRELVDCMANLLWREREERKFDEHVRELEKHKWRQVLKVSVRLGLTVPLRESLDAIARLERDGGAQRHPLLVSKELPPGPLFRDRNETMGEYLRNAFVFDRVDLAQILLDHGAPIDDHAISLGLESVNVTAFMLDNVPHETIKKCLDADGEGIVSIARHGRADVVRLLAARGVITQEDCERALGEGLAEAVGAMDLRAVRQLLEAGVSANTRTPERSKSLLAKAMANTGKKTMKIAQLLLDHGADVNPREPTTSAATRPQLSPLERAVRFGREEMVRVLLERGAEPVLRMSLVVRSASWYDERTKRCEALVVEWARARSATTSAPAITP